MSAIATTNTQHYENIADGLRTAGDLSNYKSELAVDAEIFEDISDALQSKTGQQEPYTKDELAQAVSDLPTNLIPKTITENGVYNAADDNADGYDVVTVGVPERNTLDECFAGTLEVANIPSAISIIDYLFNNNKNLIDVIMPNVTSIGEYSFRNCVKLALTSLPSGVTSIYSHAFYGCVNLALTSLPSGLKNIGQCVFEKCPKMTLTSLPSGLKSIANYSYRYCAWLTLSIPYLDFSDFTQIPTLGTYAFDDTTYRFYFRDQQQLDEWAAATNWSIYAGRFQIKPSGVI